MKFKIWWNVSLETKPAWTNSILLGITIIYFRLEACQAQHLLCTEKKRLRQGLPLVCDRTEQMSAINATWNQRQGEGEDNGLSSWGYTAGLTGPIWVVLSHCQVGFVHVLLTQECSPFREEREDPQMLMCFTVSWPVVPPHPMAKSLGCARPGQSQSNPW